MANTNNNRGIATAAAVLLFAAGAFGFHLFQQEAAARKLNATVSPPTDRFVDLSQDDLAQIKSMNQKVYRACLKEAENPTLSRIDKEAILSGVCQPLLQKYKTQYGEEP